MWLLLKRLYERNTAELALKFILKNNRVQFCHSQQQLFKFLQGVDFNVGTLCLLTRTCNLFTEQYDSYLLLNTWLYFVLWIDIAPELITESCVHVCPEIIARNVY